MLKQKQDCGALYKKIVMGYSSPAESKVYHEMKLKLMDMIAEIDIVNQMIADGHA